MGLPPLAHNDGVGRDESRFHEGSDPIFADSMRDRISDARRVVVKLGSSLFFNDAGAIALGRIFSFIEDIAAARLAGRQMIVVSSGAVALGADALKMKSATASLAQKPALAGVGQSRPLNWDEPGLGS